MSDHEEKAGKLKFAFYPKLKAADYFLFGYSLMTGSVNCFRALILQEILFHYFISRNFKLILDIVYVTIILWSLARVMICLIYNMANLEKNFLKQKKCLKAIKAITIIQIFNSLVLLILALFQKDMGIGYRASFMNNNYYKYYYHPEDMVLPVIVILIFICINVYIYYILFSFTKHFGLGNEALIFNNKPASIPQSKDLTNLPAFLLANNQSIEIIVNNTFTQYVSLEKIVLNFPSDITYA
jgi:hypothetical protein